MHPTPTAHSSFPSAPPPTDSHSPTTPEHHHSNSSLGWCIPVLFWREPSAGEDRTRSPSRGSSSRSPGSSFCWASIPAPPGVCPVAEESVRRAESASRAHESVTDLLTLAPGSPCAHGGKVDAGGVLEVNLEGHWPCWPETGSWRPSEHAQVSSAVQRLCQPSLPDPRTSLQPAPHSWPIHTTEVTSLGY